MEMTFEPRVRDKCTTNLVSLAPTSLFKIQQGVVLRQRGLSRPRRFIKRQILEKKQTRKKLSSHAASTLMLIQVFHRE
jgi:hypothetical protein